MSTPRGPRGSFRTNSTDGGNGERQGASLDTTPSTEVTRLASEDCDRFSVRARIGSVASMVSEESPSADESDWKLTASQARIPDDDDDNELNDAFPAGLPTTAPPMFTTVREMPSVELAHSAKSRSSGAHTSSSIVIAASSSSSSSSDHGLKVTSTTTAAANGATSAAVAISTASSIVVDHQMNRTKRKHGSAVHLSTLPPTASPSTSKGRPRSATHRGSAATSTHGRRKRKSKLTTEQALAMAARHQSKRAAAFGSHAQYTLRSSPAISFGLVDTPNISEISSPDATPMNIILRHQILSARFSRRWYGLGTQRVHLAKSEENLVSDPKVPRMRRQNDRRFHSAVNVPRILEGTASMISPQALAAGVAAGSAADYGSIQSGVVLSRSGNTTLAIPAMAGYSSRMNDEGTVRVDSMSQENSEAYDGTPLLPSRSRFKKAEEGWTCRLITLVICTNVGGFLIGFVGALLNPILADIYSSCDMQSSVIKGLLVSTSAVGGFIGAGIGIISNDKLGRRNSIIFSDFWMGLGSIVVLADVFTCDGEIGTCQVSQTSVIFARLIQGIGVGLAGMSIPIYLSEIAPAEVRGGTMSIHSASQMLGQMSAICICVAIFQSQIQKSNSFYWKWLIVGVCVPCIIHAIMMLWFPKSPRWLVEKDRAKSAIKVLMQLAGLNYRLTPEESATFSVADRQRHAELKKRYQSQALKMHQTYASVSKNQYDLWNSITSIAFRNALLIGCGLAVFQQFSGINTLMNYSTTIIEDVGLAKSQKSAVIWSIPIVTIQFVSAMASVRIIDRSGRKPLLTYSLIGVFVSLLFLTVTCYIVSYLSALEQSMDSSSSSSSSSETSNNGDSNNQTHRMADQVLTVARWGILVAIILYIMVYAPGLGPVPVAVNSEIFPTHLRGLGASFFIMVTWLASSIITLLFPVLTQLGGMGTAFAFSCFCSLLGILFVRVFVFETKGRDLEKIMRSFSKANLNESRKSSMNHQ